MPMTTKIPKVVFVCNLCFAFFSSLFMCPEANRLVLISGTVVPVRNEAEVDHGANRTVRDVHGGGEGDELLHVRGVHFVV